MSLSLLKLSLIDIIYKEKIKEEIHASLSYLVKRIIDNDNYFKSFAQYHLFISQLGISFIDLCFIKKWSGNVAESYLNFLKIDISKSSPLNTEVNNKFYLYSLCLIIANCTIHRKTIFFNESLTCIMKVLMNFIHKCYFIFQSNSCHSNFIEFLFNVMVINKGIKNKTKQNQIIVFIIYGNIQIQDCNKMYFPSPKANKSLALFQNKCLICKNVILINKITLKCCGRICCLKCIQEYMRSHDQCFFCQNKIMKVSVINLYSDS